MDAISLDEIATAIAALGEEIHGPGVGPSLLAWRKYRPQEMPSGYRIWVAMGRDRREVKSGKLLASQWRQILDQLGLEPPKRNGRISENCRIAARNSRQIADNSTGEPVEFINPETASADYPFLRLSTFQRRMVYIPHRHGWREVEIATIL